MSDDDLDLAALWQAVARYDGEPGTMVVLRCFHDSRRPDLDENVTLADLRRLLAFADAARPVLEFVSIGRGGVSMGPYPDATARRALGMLALLASSADLDPRSSA